jgi:hypothetical protein
MSVFLQPIYTQTVTAANVSRITFNNIPQTFTDLVIKVSQRNTHSGPYEPFVIGFNNDTNTIYSQSSLGGDGSSVNSYRTSGNSYLSYTNNMSVNAATSTTNTFGSLELYMPNYTGSNFKSVIVDSVTENNSATNVATGLLAGLFRSTSAVSRVDVIGYNANISQYTTITIYGVTRG